MSVPRPIEGRVIDKYRLWLGFTDGASGEVSLGHLAGQGVFAARLNPRLPQGGWLAAVS